jgi:hypothetical protein
MNYTRRQDRTFREIAAFAAATALLTLAVAVPAQAQTPTILYTFPGSCCSGNPPASITYGAIAQGRNGDMYTTSAAGGTTNAGTVFRITRSGGVSVINNVGGIPYGGVTLSSGGDFFATDL